MRTPDQRGAPSEAAVAKHLFQFKRLKEALMNVSTREAAGILFKLRHGA